MQRFRKVVSIIVVFFYLFTALPLSLPGKAHVLQAYAEEELTDEQAVYLDVAALDEMFSSSGWTDSGGITVDKITLPAEGSNGTTVIWESSNDNLVDTDGNIKIPSFSTFYYYYSSTYISVKLTATVSKGEFSHNTEYNIYITTCLDETEEDQKAIEDYDYVYDIIFSERWENWEGYEGDHFDFPVTLPNGSTISWSSNRPDVVASDGTINRPPTGEGNVLVQVSFLITRGSDYKAGGGFPVVIPEGSFEEDLEADMAWLTPELVLGENIADEVRGRLNLPTSGPKHSKITWSFSEDGIVLPTGAVMRPSLAEGSKTLTLTATLHRGAFSDTKTFTFTVKASSSEEEASLLNEDADWIYGQVFYLSPPDDIREYHLPLPVAGLNGSAISWVSSDPDVISVTGEVTRPAFSRYLGHAPVTLTATVTRRDTSTVKTYEVMVYPEYPTDEARVAYCKEKYLINEIILNGNDPVYVKTDLALPTSNSSAIYYETYIGGCTISWQSSHPGVIAPDGTVNRPVKGQPSVTVTLTATISYYEATDTKSFTFTVTPKEEYPLAVNYDDFNTTDRLQFNGVSGTVDTTGRTGESVKALKFSNGTGSSGGSVFTKNRIRLGEDLSFSTAFTFRINNLTDYYDLDKKGAFTFTLQGIGSNIYSQDLNDSSIKPSLSIAFTTSRSARGSNYVDVSAQAFYNGDYSTASERSRIGTFRASELMDHHTIWIEYDGTRKVIELWYSTSGDRPAINYIHIEIENVDLGEILRGAGDSLTLEDVRDVYAGFMGSMGDAREDIEIYDWYLKNDSAPIDKRVYDLYDVSDITLSAVASEELLESILTVTVSGKSGPMAEIPVELHTDLGTLSPGSVETDELGKATIILNGTHTGVAHVKAIAPGGAMAEAEVPLSATDEDSVDFDIAWLSGAGLTLLLNGNSRSDDVSTALNLPSEGPDGSSISWSSDNAHISALDGSVTPPDPEDGDQQVTLTATLTKNAAVKTTTIILTVRVPDPDAVSADDSWLTDEMILNGNSDWDNILTGLSMPIAGYYGSSISWTSSRPDIIDLNGTVNRPTYTDGDQTVDLTAVISKGAASVARDFTATVKALDPDDFEAVDLTEEWLEWDIIKNDNAAPSSVTGDLILPETGLWETDIFWTSSNTDFLAANGEVRQPAYSQGKKKVTLTAVISRGDASVQKTFEISILTLPQTDAERVEADKNWLDISRTLGQNLSELALIQDLDLPATGPNESVITWSSDKPEFISKTGMVTRPLYTEGHKVVKVTATFRKGSTEETKVFTYTVLAEPDVTPPKIIKMDVRKNGIQIASYDFPFDVPELPWNTTRVSIQFDEVLEYQPGSSAGIRMESPDVTPVWGKIWDNSVIFDIIGFLKPGAVYEIIIPSHYVGDVYGNIPTEDIRIPIRVEERPSRTIQVISSTPADREKDVSLDLPRVTLKLNYSDVITGENYRFIKLTDKYGASYSAFSGLSLNGDEITIEVNKRLEYGQIYKVVIPAGAFTDRYENQNIEQTIMFRAENYLNLPVIESVYPPNGQLDVDIHQRIDVVFTEAAKYTNMLTLIDEQGYTVAASHQSSLEGNRKKISIIPYQPLKPNAVYRLKGPNDLVGDTSQLEFELSFITGENRLGIISLSPSDMEKDVPIDSAVEIEFSAPPMKDTGFSGIEFTDSEGNPVSFHGEERGNKALIIPDSDLDEDKVYFVRIPKGAYTSQGGLINDTYEFCFRTDKRLELDTGLIDAPSKGLVGLAVRLSAERIETLIKSANHEAISYQWDFADRRSESVKNPEHIFSQPGDYLVRLTVQDNKGFIYEFEKEISIIPIQDVKMTVSRKGSTDLYIAQGWSPLSRTYNIRLECDDLFVPGERINAALYKNGNLVKTYDEFTSGTDSAYTFVFTPGSDYLGSYQLVFTYNSPAGVMTNRDSLRITASGASSYLRVQLYDRRNGEIYSEADYLNVKVEGQSKVAVREWIPSLNEYVYTVQEQFPILRYYKFELEGFDEYSSDQRIADYSNSYGILYNVGELGDFYSRPPVKKGFRPNYGLCRLVDTDALRPFYIEGVNAGTRTFAVEGNWNGMTPDYYELKTTSGNIHIKSPSYHFKLDTSKFKAGDQLMMRMVSKNGIASNWAYWDLNVLPKPKILGVTVDVGYESGMYFLTLKTPFDGVMGGAIEVLDGIPYLEDAEFGIGGGMPNFTGVIYTDTIYKKDTNMLTSVVMAEADFSGEIAYKQKTKQSKKLPQKLKKIKMVGYEIELEVEGYFELFWDKESRQWKTQYMWIDIFAWGEKSWSKGWELIGGIGITGTLWLDAFVNGVLIVDRQDGVATKYSGIVGFGPGFGAGVNGSYGIGSIGGSVSADLSAELHIPTGYFEVEFDVMVNIYNTIMGQQVFFSGYNKKLVGIHWDNGKPKVVYRMAVFAEPSDEEEQSAAILKPMNRNYLNRESVWLGGNATSSMQRAGAALMGPSRYASGTSDPEPGVLMSNIYPDAAVQLVQSGDELWLVWIDDNPARDDINRTQLHYSVYSNGTWSEPEWLDNDGTADFSSALASVPNGVLIAWQDVSKVVSEEEGLRGMLENSAISVTLSPYVNGGTFETVTFPNDGKTDHSPRLAASGDNAILVWTRSEGLGFTLGGDMEDLKAPANSDSLLFSRWNGSSWSEPMNIQTSLATILESNLTMHGDQGLLLYTLDMDNDMSTSEDREIFAVLFDGSIWGPPVRITNNDLNEINPQAAYLNGDWFITWVQDGSIQYKKGLSGQPKTWGLEGVPNDYKLAVLEGNYPQVALVCRRTGNDLAQSLYAVFYDAEAGAWSGEILLGEENLLQQEGGFIQKFDPLFTHDGKLITAYTQAEIITEAIPVEIDGEEKTVEKSAVSDKVDLKVMTYVPVHDMAFDTEEGLRLSSETPFSETMITVFATVVNQGDFAESVIGDLYDGDPEAGGRKIASSDELTIPARAYVDVEMEWLVPSEERDEYHLYAVIRQQRGIPEKDISNNTISLAIQTANVFVDGLVCENAAKKDYILDAVIINGGAKTLNDIAINLIHTDSGEIVKAETIRKLDPGQAFPVSMIFSAAGLVKDENGNINMALVVVLPDGVNEQSTEDNVCEFAIVPATIFVNGGYPAPDETRVPVDSAITLSFNMKVEAGDGFDGIVLEDEDLNVIEVTKTIDEDTLTITPVGPLANGTQYTLIVPADALGDSYGHIMAGPYTMSFTTTSEYPEVTFAWPFDGMEDAALNTEIRLMFNQDISGGPTYSDVALYGENDTRVQASVSIDDSWLYIRPAESLTRDTAYTVVIPRGAVANGDKALQEDYRLDFTTGNISGNEDNDPGDNDPGDNDPGDKGDNNTGGPKPMDSYNANIEATGSIKNIKLSVRVDSNTGKASVDLAKLSEGIFLADENNTISVPFIPGVNTYTLEMPAASLSDDDGKGTLTFETNVGSITVRPDMLSGMAGLAGKTAGINIAVGDKTGLPDKIREVIGDRPLVQLTLTLDGEPAVWSNPSSPVSVTIPYTPSEEELKNPESIVIWYIDGSGRAVSVPNGRYDPAAGTVTFITTHFSHYAVAYYPVSFRDVPDDAWYKKAVDFIAARQITYGTGNGNYSPNASITRGEFITLLLRAFEIDPDNDPTDNFNDAGSTYFTGYIAAAKRLGITHGIGNNLFAPGREITRQEMFTMLYNALRVINILPEGSTGKTLDDFTDAKEIDLWAKEAFALFVDTGIVVGNNGKLAPNGMATRAEMAQVLFRLLLKLY